MEKNVIAEIQQTLDQDDAQVMIALGENYKAKEGLLQSPKLHAEGLMALCINPIPMNIHCSEVVQERFKEAIARTELTEEQQVLIAEIGEFVYSKVLLSSTKLTAEALVAICENSEGFDLNIDAVKKQFKEAFERTELTNEQQVQIAKIGKFVYSETLLESTKLTAEALVAICENSGEFDLNIDTVQRQFKEAFARTELTNEQQVRIVQSKLEGMWLF